MIGKDQISEAVWANDALADEGHRTDAILGRLGVDTEAATYMAMQRALRAIGSRRAGEAQRITRGAYEGRSVPVSLSARERREQIALAALWLDAFAAGFRAARNNPDA